MKLLYNFDITVKNNKETYKKIIDISNNDGYTSGNLLDYDYFLKRYKLNAIDLSKQVEFENQINNKLILLVNLKKIVEQQCFS